MNHLVRKADPAVAWKDLHELLFNLLGRVAFCELKTARNAENMRVDHNPFGRAKADAENNIGSFARCAGDSNELRECLRNLTIEIGDDLTGRALNRFGFVAIEAGCAYKFFEFRQRCLGHGCGGRKAAEELRCDQIDAHIGALRGENRGDEKLPGRAVMESAYGVGIGLVERPQNGGDAFRSERATSTLRLS
jgi:hypothetical protein